MNSTVENDKPQLKTKTRNGTRKRGNLPDSISSTAEIFKSLNKAFHIYKEREPFPSPQEPPNDLFVSKRVTIPRTSVKIAVVSFFSEVLCFKRGT